MSEKSTTLTNIPRKYDNKEKASPEGRVQALTTACFMDQTRPTTQRTAMPSNSCEMDKKQKKGSQTKKIQKVQVNEFVNDIRKKRVSFKKNHEAEAKAARADAAQRW